MTQVEKIKAEIEKLRDYQISCIKSNYRLTGKPEENIILECNKLLSFINSMQAESVSEDLEEACEQLAENARKHKAETLSPFFSPIDYKQGVIDGANWQKEQMLKDAADANVSFGQPVLLAKSIPTNVAKDGDKVKLIIIKEN